MKQWIKKWWFSILCFVTAIAITIYCTIIMFIDNDLFVRSTMLISSLTASLVIIVIGAANQPKNEK